MNLTEATPAEVDAQLFAALAPAQRTEAQIAGIKATQRRYVRAGAEVPAHYDDSIARLEEKLAGQMEVAAPFEAEFQRRGGWVRYLVVQGGHLHKQSCHTLTPGVTMVGLVAEASGLDADQVVGKFGEVACTHCFPEAPVVTREQREKVSAEKKAAKASEREAKAAAKQARKIERAEKLIVKADRWIADNGGLEALAAMPSADSYMKVWEDPKMQTTVADQVLLDIKRQRCEPLDRWDLEGDARTIVAAAS